MTESEALTRPSHREDVLREVEHEMTNRSRRSTVPKTTSSPNDDYLR